MKIKMVIPIALAALLLAGIAAESRYLHVPAGDVAAYHLAVRRQAARTPDVFGDWVAAEATPPIPAVALLRPNVILSRRYMNVHTGRQAQLFFAHCEDVRDMLAYHPPISYAGQGWTLISHHPADWTVGDQTLAGNVYEFARIGVTPVRRMVIHNVLVLPDGRYARDISALGALESHYTRRYLGAAQLQVILDAEATPAERDAVFRQLVETCLPLLRITQFRELS